MNTRPPLASRRSFIRRAVIGIAIAGLVGGTAACGGGDDAAAGGGSVKLGFTAYSTPQEAYKEILPAFSKTPEGQGVTFSESYGASGAQSRAVAAGLPTDVVALSLAPDVDKLVEPGIVAKDWANDEFNGFVTNSVVVFLVRKGNPKGLKTWEDLVKPDVKIVTPNPFTSGGAMWNTMAAWGSQIEQGKSEDEAKAYLEAFYKNVVSQDKSAREALQTFSSGQGDVLISYENEAITAQQKNVPVDYVIPPQTLLIQNPVAVTENGKNKEKAQALVKYLRGEEAQKTFAKFGYRPVIDTLRDKTVYPDPAALFTIDKFGGWPEVVKKFFTPEGIVGKIEQQLGVTTG